VQLRRDLQPYYVGEILGRRIGDSCYQAEIAEEYVSLGSIHDKSKRAKYKYWKTLFPSTSSATVSQTLFPKLDETLCHFLTPTMLKVQRTEIKNCLNYQASTIMQEEIIEYQEVVIVILRVTLILKLILQTHHVILFNFLSLNQIQLNLLKKMKILYKFP